jgi:hypothetical protein
MHHLVRTEPCRDQMLAGLLPEVSEEVMAATDLADRELRHACYRSGTANLAGPPPLPTPIPE